MKKIVYLVAILATVITLSCTSKQTSSDSNYIDTTAIDTTTLNHSEIK